MQSHSWDGQAQTETPETITQSQAGTLNQPNRRPLKSISTTLKLSLVCKHTSCLWALRWSNIHPRAFNHNFSCYVVKTAKLIVLRKVVIIVTKHFIDNQNVGFRWKGVCSVSSMEQQWSFQCVYTSNPSLCTSFFSQMTLLNLFLWLLLILCS